MAAVIEIAELADQNPEFVTLDELSADDVDGLSLDSHEPPVTEANIDQQVDASNAVPANVTVRKRSVQAEDTPRAVADMPCMSPVGRPRRQPLPTPRRVQFERTNSSSSLSGSSDASTQTTVYSDMGTQTDEVSVTLLPERKTKVQTHGVRPTVSSGSSDDTHRTQTRRSRRSNNQTTQAVGIPVQVRPKERYQKVSSGVHSTPNDNTHVRPKSIMNTGTIPQRRSTIQPRLGENSVPKYDAPLEQQQFDDGLTPGQSSLSRNRQSVGSRLSLGSTIHGHKEVKPPKFNGKGDVEMFMAEFLEVSELNEWSAQATLIHLKNSLSDEATPCRRCRTSALIFRDLRARFGITLRDARLKLVCLKQGKMSYHQLADEVEKLISVINKGYPISGRESPLSESMKVDSFIDALHSEELKRFLTLAAPRNLTAAIQNCMTFSSLGEKKVAAGIQNVNANLTQSGSRATKPSAAQDELERRIGRMESSLSQLMQEVRKLTNSHAMQPAPMRSQRQERPGLRRGVRNSNFNESKPPSRGQAWFNSNSIVCWNCNRTGHIRRDCPQPWRQSPGRPNSGRVQATGMSLNYGDRAPATGMSVNYHDRVPTTGMSVNYQAGGSSTGRSNFQDPSTEKSLN